MKTTAITRVPTLTPPPTPGDQKTTCNLPITSRLRYHCATRAQVSPYSRSQQVTYVL
jgi:hypothetical protein